MPLIVHSHAEHFPVRGKPANAQKLVVLSGQALVGTVAPSRSGKWHWGVNLPLPAKGRHAHGTAEDREAALQAVTKWWHAWLDRAGLQETSSKPATLRLWRHARPGA